LAKLAKYYALYVTDREIIRFMDGFKEKKQNRNRFVVDLLRLAARFQDELAKAVGTVESQPHSRIRRCEPSRLDQTQLIQAINESLRSWKERKAS